MRRIWIVTLGILLSVFLTLPTNTSVINYGGNEDVIGATGGNDSASPEELQGNLPGNETEYWALIVAVGVYANNPDMDRPSMLVEADKLKNMLPVSSNWDESHIKVITGENATVPNIINGFRWLDEMEDENDASLVYLTTHGFPIFFDLPPFDEADGMDEALATYRGFLPFEDPFSWEPLANPFAILTDDEINFLLNRLESKAIGLIVDSCYSGGFNDNWSYSKAASEDWATEFAGELQGRNRVIVTSVPETETSYGSYFSNYIIKGLQGYGDSNGDGLCSLEEAFNYAKPIIQRDTGMNPQIFDDYPGELVLTEKEMPPSQPEVPEGQEIGKTNTTYTYQLLSSDPEGDNIKYLVDWGDGNQEWTSLYNAGGIASVSHSWNKEGTYNIRAMASDEKGAESEWSDEIAVTMADHHVVDQRQTKQYWVFLVNDTRWCAQSFVPSVSNLSEVELAMMAWDSGSTLTVFIRGSLYGPDLEKAERDIDETGETTTWTMFSFPSISVIPGNTYYIICSGSLSEGWGTGWAAGRGNPYEKGDLYTSSDAGVNWEKYDRDEADGCFVTYG